MFFIVSFVVGININIGIFYLLIIFFAFSNGYIRVEWCARSPIWY